MDSAGSYRDSVTGSMGHKQYLTHCRTIVQARNVATILHFPPETVARV